MDAKDRMDEIIETPTEGEPDGERKMTDLTLEEIKAISSLKRLAKRWPESLWLFSADTTLSVMKRNGDGEQAMVEDARGHMCVDHDYEVDVIYIPNDGGQW